MLLTEYEAKKLLAQAQLPVPKHFLVPQNVNKNTYKAIFEETFGNTQDNKYYVKAQVLHGNRAEQGLVLSTTKETVIHTVTQLLQKKDQDMQAIPSVLVEQAIPIGHSLYVALRYDTVTRKLVCLYSENGGSGMDDRGDTLQKILLSVLEPPSTFDANPKLLPTIQKLWQVFTTQDATLVEINPLAKIQKNKSSTSQTEYICLDAKIELDDTALFRHPEWNEYSERSAFGRPPTPLEKRAHQVSRSDHRGVAGESFFELPGGEIGVMASGGGASTLAMDALLAVGIKPANYTEYSGNPSREKVHALTNVVLSIPNLRGLYVVGSNANFTDIYETLAGVVDGLLESPYVQSPDITHTAQNLQSPNIDSSQPFALLIRRGGPRWQEAFSMVKERLQPYINTGTIKMKLCGPDFPLLDTAQEMKQLMQ